MALTPKDYPVGPPWDRWRKAYLVASSSPTRLRPGASRGIVAIASSAFSRPGGLSRAAPAHSPGNGRLGGFGAGRIYGRRWVHGHISTPRPVVAPIRRTVTGAVARAPQGRHRLHCPRALPAPQGRPIAQAPAGERDWTAGKGWSAGNSQSQAGSRPLSFRVLREEGRRSVALGSGKQENEGRHGVPL